MPAPTVSLSTTGIDPKLATKAGLEAMINPALASLYDGTVAEETARKAAETIRVTSMASADGLTYTATSPVAALVVGSRFTARTPASPVGGNAGSATLSVGGLVMTMRSAEGSNLTAGLLLPNTQYDFMVESAALVRVTNLFRSTADNIKSLEGFGAAKALMGPNGRPGDEPLAFTHFPTGNPADRPALTLGGVVSTALQGKAWRLNGAQVPVEGYQDVAPRAVFSLELGTIRRVRYEVARAVDPVDPASQAIECRIVYLDENYALLAGGGALHTVAPSVADGIQRYTATLSRSAGADQLAPAGARYCVPFLRVYGADHQTDVAVISAEDVTSVSKEASDFSVSLDAEEEARILGDIILVTEAASADGLSYTATSPVPLATNMHFLMRTPAISNAGAATITVGGLAGAAIRSREGNALLEGMMQLSTDYLFRVDSPSLVRCLTISRADRTITDSLAAALATKADADAMTIALAAKANADAMAIALAAKADADAMTIALAAKADADAMAIALAAKADDGAMAIALAAKADADAMTIALAAKADDGAMTIALAAKADQASLDSEASARAAADIIRVTGASTSDGLSYTATSPVPLAVGSRFSMTMPATTNASGSPKLFADGLNVAGATIRGADNLSLLAGMLVANTAYDFVVDSSLLIRCLGVTRSGENRTVALQASVDASEADIVELDARLAGVENQVNVIASPSFSTSAEFTSSGSSSPVDAAPPVASVVFGPVEGFDVARMTDLTSAEFVLCAIRAVFAIKPNTTYRISVIARLVSATVVGTNQARLQFNLLNGSYGLMTNAGGLNITLNDSYATYTTEWTSGEAPTEVFFRPSFFKWNSYTDLTAQLDVLSFEVMDLTNGANLAQRVSALENGASGDDVSEATMVNPMVYATAVPVPSGVKARQPAIANTSSWLCIQPAERIATITNNSVLPKYDLGHMITDTVAYFYTTTTTAKFYAGLGQTFTGAGANNILTLEGPGVVLVTKMVDRLSIVALSGSATFSAEADPIKTKSIVGGGQSNMNNWFGHGGIGGFNRAARDSNWMSEGVFDPEANWINGSTGGTALLKSSVVALATNWWYDPPTLAIGVPFQFFFDQIDAAIAAGQPVPTTVFWSQGESDVFALENGTTTVAEYQAAVVTVFGLIRDFLISRGAVAADIKILVFAISSNEPGPLRRVGTSRVRQAYTQAIDSLAYAYRAAPTIDVERALNDTHWTANGYNMVGRRMARAYAKIVLGDAYDLGPVATSAVKAADQRTVVVNISTTGTLSMPPGLHGEGYSLGRDPAKLGGAPMLLGLVKADGGLIKINKVTVGTNKLTLVADADIPDGTTLHYPFGYAPEARFKDYVTDTQEDAASGTPGIPLADFAIVI